MVFLAFLHDANLFRFQRILRYGDRLRADVQHPPADQFQQPVQGFEHSGFLAALAYHAVAFPQGLPVYSVGRQQKRRITHIRQHIYDLFHRRIVARCGMDFCRMGLSARFGEHGLPAVEKDGIHAEQIRRVVHHVQLYQHHLGFLPRQKLFRREESPVCNVRSDVFIRCGHARQILADKIFSDGFSRQFKHDLRFVADHRSLRRFAEQHTGFGQPVEIIRLEKNVFALCLGASVNLPADKDAGRSLQRIHLL